MAFLRNALIASLDDAARCSSRRRMSPAALHRDRRSSDGQVHVRRASRMPRRPTTSSRIYGPDGAAADQRRAATARPEPGLPGDDHARGARSRKELEPFSHPERGRRRRDSARPSPSSRSQGAGILYTQLVALPLASIEPGRRAVHRHLQSAGADHPHRQRLPDPLAGHPDVPQPRSGRIDRDGDRGG